MGVQAYTWNKFITAKYLGQNCMQVAKPPTCLNKCFNMVIFFNLEAILGFFKILSCQISCTEISKIPVNWPLFFKGRLRTSLQRSSLLSKTNKFTSLNYPLCMKIWTAPALVFEFIVHYNHHVCFDTETSQTGLQFTLFQHYLTRLSSP